MKKLFFGIVLLICGGLIWLLFVKSADYTVSIETKTVPGVVNQTIKTWNQTLEFSEIQQQDYKNLSQTIKFNDSTFLVEWNITGIHDSLSEIKIGFSDKNSGPMTRLTHLFTETDFEKRARLTALDFNENLKNHLDNFRVKVIGESTIDSTYYAYVTEETTQIGKASGMMRNYSYVSTFLAEKKVELNGLPIVEITEWDRDQDRIKFNFCYPVKYSDSFPEHEEIAFKLLKSQKALKAIYNGNYISSDRAWYYLMEYAERNKISVDPKPVEFFFNNPNMGGNSMEWSAEVYMPIK